MTPSCNCKEYGPVLDMALALWERHGRIIRRTEEFTPHWPEVLAEVEANYRAYITALAAEAEKHLDIILNWLRFTKGPALEIACHVLIEGASERCYQVLDEIVIEERLKQYWAVIDMIRYCRREVTTPFLDRIVPLQLKWLNANWLAILARNGYGGQAKVIVQRLLQRPNDYIDQLIDGAGFVDTEVLGGELVAQFEGMLGKRRNFVTKITLARTLYMLNSEAGPAFYWEQIKNHFWREPDMCWWFASCGTRNDAKLLAQLLREQKLEEWPKALVYALGLAGDIAAIPLLLEAAGHQKEGVRVAANDALGRMLGLGADEDPYESKGGELKDWWNKWWADNGSSFVEGLRYYEGQPVHLEQFIAEMESDDQDVRELVHEKLIVYTGVHFPFDPKGFCADRQSDLEHWREWIAVNADRFPAGEWWRWGQVANG